MNVLEVKNLRSSVAGKEILHGVDFELSGGECAVLVGANGAGKSTIVHSLIGDTNYDCSADKLALLGKSVRKKSCDERARAGMFLSFQEPVAVPGLSLSEMLRSALEARGQKISLMEFKKLLSEKMEILDLNPMWAKRDLNVGFSGGEKKKLEILQMLVLEPKLVLLDELDSGLDIDAAKKLSSVLEDYRQKTSAAFLVISHNFRILQYLKPTKIFLVDDGRITERGDEELLNRVKRSGFKK